MKTLKENKRLSILILLTCLTVRTFAASPVTLEHTFDGCYIPYNFPTYLPSEDDRYFYCPLITADDGNISMKTYNEDYSLRDNYNVNLSIPINYKVYSVSFSSSFQLSDGTPFFIVVYTSTSIPYGESNYTIAKMYDARNGSPITDLGSSSGTIQTGDVYLINGKISICMFYNDVTQTSDSYSYSIPYLTKIFSLGKSSYNSVTSTENSNRSSEPIFTYDMNGRLINQSYHGQPYIGVMQDGSSKIMINR